MNPHREPQRGDGSGGRICSWNPGRRGIAVAVKERGREPARGLAPGPRRAKYYVEGGKQ